MNRAVITALSDGMYSLALPDQFGRPHARVVSRHEPVAVTPEAFRLLIQTYVGGLDGP